MLIVNDIFPKPNNAQYLYLINTSSVIHNLRLDAQSSCLTMFTGQSSRYRCKLLLYGTALAANIFQRKIDEIFRQLPNALGTADDIMVVSYDSDGADNDRTLHTVLQICEKEN